MKNAFKALFYQLRLKLQSSQGNNKEHINGLIYSKAPKTLFSTVKIVYAKRIKRNQTYLKMHLPISLVTYIINDGIHTHRQGNDLVLAMTSSFC